MEGGGNNDRNVPLPSLPVNRLNDDQLQRQTWKNAQTLSAEIFENCGNLLIVEDYLLLLWNKTL